MSRSGLARPALIVFTLLMVMYPAMAAIEGSSQEIDWKLSGEARFRPEWRDNRDLDSDLNDDARMGFMRFRLGLEASYKDDYRVFLQVQDSRVAGQEASTASNEENLDLHQGYLELRNLGSERFSLTIGRQEWSYGEQRLMGAFNWNNVGRSFDGAKLRYAGEDWMLDGLLARVSESPAGITNHGSDLYGVQYETTPAKGRNIGGYWLLFSESVRITGETGVPDATDIHALGGRLKDRWGIVDFNVELAVQTGEFHGDDHEAQAAALQAGLNLGENGSLRIFGGYDYASGDEDSTDGDSGEFFNFFPTNHLHYGYADYEGWRNIRSPYVGISMKHGKHFWMAKFHSFQLDEAGGPWKDAGGGVLGFDPTGMSGDDVGTELDLIYKIQTDRKVSLVGGVSRFDPGEFAEATRGEDASYWAFVMLTAGF